MSTYVPIQAITLGSNATDISFTGIPQTFTDLVVVCSVRSTRASADDTLLMQVNSDTTSLYSGTWMVGSGTTATSSRNSSQTAITAAVNIEAANATASTFTPVLINVQNYSNTTTNKTVLMRHSAPTREVGASVGLWRSTSAISSIKIYASIGSLASGSTFTLYGIGSGAPKAFGGNEVRTDGTYWYHIFRSSGRFEPVQALSVDYLVIAGGGGGGASQSGVSNGGGGGAGGYRTSTGFSVSPNVPLTVTVGAGGTAGSASAGGKGNNSVFSTITSTGGGTGAYTNLTGGAGGSGGGGSSRSGNDTAGGAGNEGSYSPVEGFAGGAASLSGGNYGGGGGGGASEAGNTDGQSTGGDGSASSITGTSVTYAGGGSGGTNNTTPFAAGTGGGGNGGYTGAGNGVAGTANTGGGGGGGGAGGGAAGGAGGSGIVVIRYSAV